MWYGSLEEPRIRHKGERDRRWILRGDASGSGVGPRRVLYRSPCRNYEAAAGLIPGAIGLCVAAFTNPAQRGAAAGVPGARDTVRRGRGGVFLDGIKTFADATMVIARGITLTGEKRFLGFVETDTENGRC